MRAGGKHNDLDNVGYTARHHTFFEMLGNFSFGDYFKDRAIELAWNLVTKEFGLPKERLTVTVYIDDDQAFDLWKKIAGLPDEQIIRIAGSDNFWQMGDTGPCGPCSEIFYDHGPHIPGGPPGSPDADGDRFIEIWNLVFMQYEQLPAASASTCRSPRSTPAWGSSASPRCCRARTTITRSTCSRAIIAPGRRPHRRRSPTGAQKASHRVIADHLRASSFLIADGVLPSNEGRGYVLRRIMRRAMRHAELLGAREPLMWKLVPTLTREMGQAYPELIRAEALITETLKLEETRFRKTLERGLAILDEETEGAQEGRPVSRARPRSRSTTPTAFRSTSRRTRCAPRGIDGRYRSASTPRWSASARRRARPGRAPAMPRPKPCGSPLREKARRDRIPRLRDRDRRRRRRGAGEGRQGGRRRSASGESGAVIVNQTPFYGESGGQVGDTGMMTGDGVRFRVTDTQKKAGDLFVHHRHGGGGHAEARRRRSRSRSITPAAAPSARTIPRRICCTRRCARCWAITSRRRARWSRPTGCASTSRIPSR